MTLEDKVLKDYKRSNLDIIGLIQSPEKLRLDVDNIFSSYKKHICEFVYTNRNNSKFELVDRNGRNLFVNFNGWGCKGIYIDIDTYSVKNRVDGKTKRKLVFAIYSMILEHHIKQKILSQLY